MHDFDRRLQILYYRIWEEDYPKRSTMVHHVKPFIISNGNRAILKRFRVYLENQNYGVARKHRLLLGLVQLAELFGKDFETATKEDIQGENGLLSKIMSKWSNDTTKKMSIQILKQFYRWLSGTGDYPDTVRGIKFQQKSTRRYPKEILSESEVEKVITSSDSVLGRALIATLYSSGTRIGEVGSCLVKDLSFHEDEAVLHIRESKTDERQILLVDSSVQYLREWVENHPLRDGPSFKDAPLFVSTEREFRGKVLSYGAIRKILRRAMKLSNVNKPFNPHHWRHSRATHLAKYLNEVQLCKVMGWRLGSSQPATYIHMAGKDTHDALRAAHGKKTLEEQSVQALKPKKCVVCDLINPSSAIVCRKCSRPLSLADRLVYKDRLEELEKTVSLLNNAISRLVEAGHESISESPGVLRKQTRS